MQKSPPPPLRGRGRDVKCTEDPQPGVGTSSRIEFQFLVNLEKTNTQSLSPLNLTSSFVWGGDRFLSLFGRMLVSQLALLKIECVETRFAVFGSSFLNLEVATPPAQGVAAPSPHMIHATRSRAPQSKAKPQSSTTTHTLSKQFQGVWTRIVVALSRTFGSVHELCSDQ